MNYNTVGSTQMSAFELLRKPCVDLSKLAFLPKDVFDPNSKDLTLALRAVDHVLEKLIVQNDEEMVEIPPQLADYIFTPIGSLLKQESLSNIASQYVLSIISNLLKSAWNKKGMFSEELAKQLFPIITYLINESQDESTLQERSNEFKYVTATVLQSFMKSIETQSYHKEFFSTQNRTMQPMAHSVTILLNILQHTSQTPDAQLACIDTLSILYNGIIQDGETLSYILPGNVSAISKLLVLPGRNVNYKVVCQTIKLLESLLQRVYDDIELHTHVNVIEDITDLIGDQGEIKEFKNDDVVIENNFNLESRHRNTSWLKGTSSQVNIALQSFIPRLLKRNNSIINESLIQFVSNILANCSTSLVVCKEILISVLLELETDPNSQLSQNISLVKNQINDELQHLHTHIQFDASKKIKTLDFALKIVSGYSIDANSMIYTIGTIIDSLDSQNEPSKLYASKNESTIIEQSNNIIISDNFDLSKPSKSEVRVFHKLTNETEKSIKLLLEHIGKELTMNNNISQIVETLTSNFDPNESSLMKRTITLWVIDCLLIGARMDETFDQGEIDLYILLDDADTYEASEDAASACYAALEFSNNLADEITIASEGRVINKEQEISFCTILSTIKTVSSVLKYGFEQELIEYLYIVIENLASSSPQIRYFAQECSIAIANELYEGNVKTLISENMDYLVDTISIKLNSGLTDRMSTMLMVIYKIVGYKAIEAFSDVLETIFKLIDFYHGYSELCLQFFQLFKVVVIEMKHAYLDTDTLLLGNDHVVPVTFAPWGITNFQQILNVLDRESDESNLINGNTDLKFGEDEPKNFQAYFDQKLNEIKADSDDDDDEDDDRETDHPEGNDDEEKWTSPIPKESYRILLQIFAYGDRLLKHNSKPLKIQVLEVSSLVVPLLFTQYNSMLPQIAQTWDSVVECTFDKDYAIVNSACNCIKEMIHYSGDFLTKRFIDLWKQLQKRCVLLQEISSRIQSAVMHSPISESQDVIIIIKHPAVIQGALTSLCLMLLEGMIISEMQISEDTLQEMICCCTQVIPRDQITGKSLLIGDIMSNIKYVTI